MLQTIWPQMKLLEELVKFYVFFQSPKVYVKKIIYCNVTWFCYNFIVAIGAFFRFFQSFNEKYSPDQQ